MSARAGVDPEGQGGGSIAFDEVFRRADRIRGWLTRQQARLLYSEVESLAPGSTVVEIGSHHGRSTVVLGTAARDGVRVIAIDPFPPDWRYGTPNTERKLRSNLTEAGLAGRVEVRVTSSAAALAGWSDPLALVFVDGAHDVLSARHDLGWGRQLRPGGVLLLHDAFSSIGVTLAVLTSVMWTRELRYVGRTGSLATFQRHPPSVSDRIRILREMPWWLRNVGIKVLLRLRLRWAARAVGHTDEFDPY